MLEQGLVSLLNANGGVNALVATRIYPVSGPPDAPTYPYLVYQTVTSRTTYTLKVNEFDERRIQFDVWAGSLLQCLTVKQAVRAALDGFTGALTDGTRVISALRESEAGYFDQEQRAYRLMFEYRIKFVEP